MPAPSSSDIELEFYEKFLISQNRHELVQGDRHRFSPFLAA